MRASANNSGDETRYVVDPKVRIAHVHLKVADLQRALDFYSGVLGAGDSSAVREDTIGRAYTAHSNVR